MLNRFVITKHSDYLLSNSRCQTHSSHRHHLILITIELTLLLSEVCDLSFFSQVLGQLNMPCETLSLCDEKGDVEQAGKPWNIVPAGQKIGKPKPLFSEMVLL